MKRTLYVLILLNIAFTLSVLSQTIKVDDYGAKGDGVTDDKVAIQKALDALRVKGGELQFTSGKVYTISKGVTLGDYSKYKHYKVTTTENEKATIRLKDGTPIQYGTWVFFVDNSKNVILSNLCLDGNRYSRVIDDQVAGTHCLQIFDNCKGLRLYDMKIINSVMDNIYIAVRNEDDSTTYLSDFEMYNCLLSDGWRNNMSVIRGGNFKIIGCEFDNAHGLGDPEAGIDFEPNGGGEYGYKDILVEGCSFKNNGRFGITLTKHDNIEIEGRVTIRNNYFENNGIYLLSSDNIIANNIFRKVDHKPVINSTGVEKDGIIVFSPWDEVTGSKIYNNYFYDNPLPERQHLIGLSSRTGVNNEIYSNYSNNNSIDGFVSNSSPNEQIIYDNVELTRKEVGYWSMDSDSISGVSIFDLSDFRQTGELRNNPVLVNGWYNEALDFTPDNKNIDIPIKESLNMEVNLTISAWVNWSGTNSESEQIIVGKNGDWRFGLDNSGKVSFYGENKNGATYTGDWTKSNETLSTGEWVHVATTYNGMVTTLYINGVNNGSKECIGNLSTSSVKISIGSLLGETSSFNGSIDDVKIYNYGLSSTEIDSLYRIASGHNKTKPIGLGTKASPYKINSLVNLSWLAQTPEEWNAYFIQTTDIDASKTSMWDDADDNGDGDKYNDLNDRTTEGNNEGWSPIGNSSQKFMGNYNGNGYVIKSITIQNRSANSIGFFGEIDGGVVHNLGIIKVNIKGWNKVGGLVGVCNNNTITNSYTTGAISCTDGGNDFGGLVGSAGEISSSIIKSCFSKIIITGHSSNNENVGGFAGRVSSSSTISKCYSIGEIKSKGSSIGGFVGSANSNVNISKCYSTGNIVSGNDVAGGFIGDLQNGNIKNCYSFGSVKKVLSSSGNYYGGFVGVIKDASLIEHSYSLGEVDNSFTGQGFVGSILSGTPIFTNNYFDIETSGQNSSLGATGKSSIDMLNKDTFTSSGWDMITIWDIKGNYPNLRENSNMSLEQGGIAGEIPGIKGNGTEDDPYEITTISNLSWLSQNKSVWGLHFVQTANIDASVTAMWDDIDDNDDGNKYNDPNDFTTEGENEGFSPIGNNSTKFTGVYDGNEFSINKLGINRPTSRYIGLFGQIKSSISVESVIKNLNITNENIVGDSYTGGFIGRNSEGKIFNCSTEGKVKSNSSTGYVGGFVGYNVGSASKISECFSNVEVISSGLGSYIGGFVGRNRSYAEVEKSYSKGSVVSGGNKVGGFVGQITQGKISNCYSKASVTISGNGTSVGGFCGEVYESTIEYCYSVGRNTTHTTKGFLGTESNTNIYKSNFLDIESSGCNQSAVPNAATGKTTSEMKTEATYTGWDFLNTWIIESNSYPSLKEMIVAVDEKEIREVVSEYILSQNYPNPFNPTTIIRFAIPKQTQVKLSVYNMLGEEVAELVNGNMSAGYHKVNFNASNLGSGIYLYRISAGSYVVVKKMLLLK